MPKSFKFPPLDTRQKEFLWALEEVDLALLPVVGDTRV